MAWLLFFSLICFGTAWWRWYRELLRHWKHLERLVEDLARGKRPTSFIFYDSQRFTRVAARFEAISDQIVFLSRQLDEERFNSQAILASMNEGIMVVDSGHVIQLVNGSFQKMFAVSSTPAGSTALSILRDVAVEETICAVLQNGEPRTREFSHGFQSTGFFSISSVPLKDARGRIGGVVNVFHDITRLRQLEEIRREFVANVSHELRTPLSIFQGYLETLLDTPEIEKGDLTQILQVMDRHSRRLNALLEDLLTIARLESRQESLDRVQLRLPPFLQEIARDWQGKFSEKKVRLAINAGEGLAPLQVDQFRFEQILNNLLENALKYTPEDGLISIGAIQSNGTTEITVQDSGIGIPPADLPHIFERFYRVEKARSREKGGTGLGLSIVKHIVGMHGGKVEAKSLLGEGTTILVSLPTAAKDR
jgi:two-component system phosphate regulon sensor histidine kinase PhoR